jgi:hypothetical protein
MNRNHPFVWRSVVPVLFLILAGAVPGMAQDCPTPQSVDGLHQKVDALEAKEDSVEAKLDAVEVKIDELSAAGDDLEDVLHQAWEERLCVLECTPLMWMPAANDGMLEEIRQWVSDQIDSADATGDRDTDVAGARSQLGIGDGNAANGRFIMACMSYGRALMRISAGCN